MCLSQEPIRGAYSFDPFLSHIVKQSSRNHQRHLPQNLSSSSPPPSCMLFVCVNRSGRNFSDSFCVFNPHPSRLEKRVYRPAIVMRSSICAWFETHSFLQMTVSYSGNLRHLLFRWKGSIWRWADLKEERLQVRLPRAVRISGHVLRCSPHLHTPHSIRRPRRGEAL